MEFLVHVVINVPHEMPAKERADLRNSEQRRAAELRTSGDLIRIWRDPGRQANWSLYKVRDATTLHEVLSSLPLWPWMDIEVHTLAIHPAESGAD